ncbi:iron-containing alcohol dehydrogenase [Polymorphospora rubra]|uniref:Fe-containing alcohol dehydrogenase-like C-terminal domain-containing protein n=1 Tax=Polymorphospora rubra TaxID=338584 RepID=A0A810N9U9_9ACTN|nr:iron-containing alcohol dehydrogenase [Polymorphospora rubra]BCJ70017.1 hypothetical protein Prubr_70380 [Polymorphospora rubra]
MNATDPAPRRPPPHRVAFRGEVETAALAYGDGDLVLVDPAGGRVPGVDVHPARPLPLVVEAGYPPRWTAVRSLVGRLDRHRPARLVVIGDGATLDVGKQAWLGAASAPELVLVPVGAEPWRAFAPFTSLYDPDGRRVSRVDPALGGARVVIDTDALAGRSATVRHLARADTAVHAVEVLVSRRTRDWGRALATAGLAALRRDRPADDVVAAGLVTEAFASTGLGLAHAAASPLGARAGRTHDTVNVLLGPYVVEFWGDRVDWSEVATVLGTAADAGAVAGRLRELRKLAGVPATLDAAGFGWEQVADVVPAALRSSGMPWLPEPVDDAALTGLLRRAFG